MRLSHSCSLLAAAFLCALSAPALSSGDDGVYTNRFASQFQPANLSNYAGGNLGVVPGSYWRLNHYLAYKAAKGKPLTPEQVDALSAYDWRVGPHAAMGYEQDEEQNGTGEWNAGRQKYAPALKAPATSAVGVMTSSVDHESYINCHADAFRQAAATLEARAKLGAGGKPDGWTRQWLIGQDAVFSNCEPPLALIGATPLKLVVHLPPPLPKGAPEWLKFDHAYQTAAAHFYGRNLDLARTQFQAIAQQPKSPWQTYGGYLAARSLVRKAALQHPRRGDDPSTLERGALLTQAKKELQALTTSYRPARRMLWLVEARLHPKERVAALARILDQEPFNEDTPTLLGDYLVLLDEQTRANMIQAKEPMTAWIGAMQAEYGAEAAELAPRRKLAMDTIRKSWLKQADPLWLAPLLNLAQAGELSAAEKKAAADVAPKHPLYMTLQYRLTRLDIADKELARADKNIDRLLAAHRKTMSLATANRFLALKMGTTGTLDGFLKASLRRPEQFDEAASALPEPAETADDFVLIALRHFPMSELKTLLKHPQLPAAWKARLQETVFTRALIFNDETSALELLDTIAKSRKNTAHLYARYRAAATGAPRRLAGNLILVNTRELEPAVPGTNGTVRYWGCATPSDKFELPFLDEGTAPPAPPRFLSKQQLDQADKEYKRMLALPLRSEFVAPALLEWAASKPADDEAPKALHLLVAATRMECTSGTSKPEKEQMRARYSRTAFDMLRKQFGDSKWNAATKYYY